MYAGDWILNLLGVTVVVGSGLTVVGGSAILFAVLRTARGAGGLAGARSFPPPGIADHADEVRGRMRSRYMLRARPLANPATSSYVTFEVEVADPIAVLIANGATMPITKLPPINESLRRGLAARAARPTPVAPSLAPSKVRRSPSRRRKAGLKSKPARTRTAAGA